jgi:RNase P/RNase MRP subunit POP5
LLWEQRRHANTRGPTEMVRTKERYLLVTIDDVGAAAAAEASAPVPALNHSDVQASIRDSVHRHVSGISGNGADGNAAVASVQTQHYSPQAQLVMVRVPLAQSRRVREAIELVKVARQRSVRMTVARAFGNARLARREVMRRLVAELRRQQGKSDVKRLRDTLQQLVELQKA